MNLVLNEKSNVVQSTINDKGIRYLFLTMPAKNMPDF